MTADDGAKTEKLQKQPSSPEKLTDASIALKSPEKDRLSQICSEICEYAKEVQNKIMMVVEKSRMTLEITQEILKSLSEISEYFSKSQNNQNEFGANAFLMYVNIIKEHSKITNYEIRRSKLIQNILNFIFNRTIERKITQAQPYGSPQKSRGEEEKCNVHPKETPTKFIENKMKPNIELTDDQSRMIVGRIIAFLSAFKMKNPNDPKRNINL